MGVSRSGNQLAQKLAAVANDFNDLPYKQVEDASLIVKRSVLRLAPGRLRNVGRRGSRLNARYNIGKFEGRAKSRVFATGPWQIIEGGTRPHRIPRERKRGRRRVVVIPGVGVRMWANHPGTRGKYPWRRGVEAAMPEARRVLTTTTGYVLRKHF